MLRTTAGRTAGDTVPRLRRGLSSRTGASGVDLMARAACFSRRQFHRLTIQEFGETPGAYQRRVRLDRGAALLLQTPATILDIALETGWENHESFTRAFRACFGVTPSTFRQSRGATLPLSLRAAFALALHPNHHA